MAKIITANEATQKADHLGQTALIGGSKRKQATCPFYNIRPNGRQFFKACNVESLTSFHVTSARTAKPLLFCWVECTKIRLVAA
ncbi:hypothetical protein M514_01248, partial [Trichuris suis]